ncbi:MAG: hypothetical protein HRT77_10040 [Halioglobus sp.]|nr:hypothetical protein [Halioglobus sp.]
MAKLVFYLAAGSAGAAALNSRARALVESPVVAAERAQLAVMTPRPNDQLAAPASSPFLDTLDLVLEIAVPFGQPVWRARSEWIDALGPLLEITDRAHSFLVLGYHRTFQETGSRAVRYHYLMYRRPDFSRADYLDYYVHRHYRFGLATPAADYMQNYLDQEGGRALADLCGLKCLDADTISELRLDSVEAYLSSDGVIEVGPSAGADETVFVDRGRCQSFSMDVLLDTRHYAE